MKKLNFELKNLCERHRDGSYSLRASRHAILQQMANSLETMGYRHMRADSIKPKHVEALINAYREEGLSVGTIKNRLSVIRWWAEKVNKENIMAKDNAFYGIESRVFVSIQSKAKELDIEKLQRISDDHLRATLLLQKAFGLRREEAIKFNPSYADQGTYIRLKDTWCKGGKAREIPVRTEEQRTALDRARAIAGLGSLIPQALSYIHQLRLYEKETQRAELSKMHGLRHRYAQTRYKDLTGRSAPNCGGLISRELSEEEKKQDLVARLAISQELGHEREQITAVYLGR